MSFKSLDDHNKSSLHLKMESQQDIPPVQLEQPAPPVQVLTPIVEVKPMPPPTVNIHQYDHQLAESVALIADDLKRVGEISKANKFGLFGAIRGMLVSNPIAMGLFSLIVSNYERCDHNTAGNGNYEPITKVFADDLLYLCCEKVIKYREAYAAEVKAYDELEVKDGVSKPELNTFEETFIIQLMDMATGTCPQGLNTRLLQLVACDGF